MRTPACNGRERTRIGWVGVGANSGGMSAKWTRVDNGAALVGLMGSYG
jgi:hypothetical protein